MFVDASAIAAILLGEPDADDLQERLLAAPRRFISPLAVFEATVALRREKRNDLAVAASALDDYVRSSRMTVIPITVEIGRLALDAHSRYGKGTGHPARLNMGDCFAYACAKAHAVPLLYKGDDFAHTDLA